MSRIVVLLADGEGLPLVIIELNWPAYVGFAWMPLLPGLLTFLRDVQGRQRGISFREGLRIWRKNTARSIDRGYLFLYAAIVCIGICCDLSAHGLANSATFWILVWWILLMVFFFGWCSGATMLLNDPSTNSGDFLRQHRLGIWIESIACAAATHAAALGMTIT